MAAIQRPGQGGAWRMDAEGHDPVLDALLARHRALLTGERPALLRTDQLMVTVADLPAVSPSVRRWLADPAPPRAGVHRLHIRGGSGADVLDLLASGPDPNPVRPVHLLRAAPRWRGGPAGPPVITHDCPPPPKPPDVGLPRVEVAVLDTGITPHPWFRDRPWFADVTPAQLEILDADHDLRLDSVAGHGTFVAGIVAQQATSARLRIERVLGSDGVCDEVDLIEALHELIASPAGVPDLLNLSFGGFTYDDRPTFAVAEAIARLARTTVVVAAAGNEDSDRPFWPAAFPDVVAVAALDATGTRRAAFSNHGAWVDAAAVGEDLRGPFVAPSRRVPVRGEPSGGAYFARWSGTSFAAPVVTGRIAALAAESRCDTKLAARHLLASDSGRRESDLGRVIIASNGPGIN